MNVRKMSLIYWNYNSKCNLISCILLNRPDYDELE